MYNIMIDHIGFAVKDIKAAVKWYSEVLGFDELVPPGICEMVLMGHKGLRCMIRNRNGATLEMEQRFDIPFPSNQSPLISHFSLNVEDLEIVRDNLRNKVDVFLDNEGEIVDKPDKRILYITDPDGIRIELIQND